MTIVLIFVRAKENRNTFVNIIAAKLSKSRFQR